MPENHEKNKHKTELVYAGLECDPALFYSEPPRTGSRCSGVAQEGSSNITTIDATNSELQENEENIQKIENDVTQESKLTQKELVLCQEKQRGLKQREDLLAKEILPEKQKSSNGDDDSVESNHSEYSIGNELSPVNGQLSCIGKDDIRQSYTIACEKINMVLKDRQEAEIVCDSLKLVKDVLHSVKDKLLAPESYAANQERKLLGEIPEINKLETKLRVSQDAVVATEDSSPNEPRTNALKGQADDTKAISPILQDIPLVLRETLNVTITKSSESTENKVKPCSTSDTHCVTKMESVLTHNLTEIIETEIIDSSSSGKPSASSLSTVNTHIVAKTHPDGGWGWFVCVGAFLVQFMVLGMQNSAGIVYTELVKELKSPRGATAWVGSLATGIMFFLGPLTTSLCERLGCRIVTICGGLVCILALLLSSVVTSLPPLYFTYGLMFGTGTSLCYFPTIIVLSKYFKRRIAIVNGLVTAGSGVGTLVIGPAIQVLFLRFRLANTFRILAGIFSIVILCGASYRPVPAKYAQYNDAENKGEEKRKVFDWSIFKNKGYVIWLISLGTFQLGYFVPFVHLPRHAEDLGVTPTDASFLIGYMSVASTLSRLFFGKMADLSCVNRIRLYQSAIFAVGLCSFFLPLATSYGGLAAYAITFGFFESCFVLLIPLVAMDIVGAVKMPYALGSAFTVMAFPMFLGPPIAGWMYDVLGDYAGAFFFCGSTSLAAASVMFFVPQSSLQTKVKTKKRRKHLSKSKTLSNVQYSVIITTRATESV